MVPNSPHVRAAVLGENGVAEGAKPGTVIIDMSSIDPTESRAIGAELEKLGIDMLDAPVSGGEPKAIDGTLSVMVGGKKELFDKYYDMLMVMAGSVVYVGDLGAGNVAKLANQIVVAVNIAAVSEALTFAKKAGTDPGTCISGNPRRPGWFYGYGCKSSYDAQPKLQAGIPHRTSHQGFK